MPHLRRSLSLWLTICYGLGTILGAGIYVLIGEVAALSGIFTPLAFLTAAIVATFTAISYAKLASYYPKSAGEAVYIQEAFGKKILSWIVGWLVVITGIVSAATLANGFVGYFRLFLPAPPWIIITLLILGIGAIAAWGIKQSVILTMVITLIEVAGLILVVVLGSSEIDLKHVQGEYFQAQHLAGIFLGGFLAFYAFIGFEDIVNIAEEVKNPRRTVPKAIFFSIGIATVLYVIVSSTVILAIPMEKLAGSSAPLALIFIQKGLSPLIIGGISLIAIINGALVQLIMASRIVYGMGALQGVPQIFSRVSKVTHTPLIATGLITALTLILALWFPLTALAKATSFIILIIFSFVNLSLLTLVVKQRLSRRQRILPTIGLICCLAFLLVVAIL